MADNEEMVDIKAAIQIGDAAVLRRLLSEDSTGANRLIEWGAKGEIRTHPLHFVSDKLFDGTLQRGSEMPLIDALLTAGADCNYQAANGETPLIGAASLEAEDVGLRLLDFGALPDTLGGFKETALHWAAHLGLRRLAARLLERNANVDVKDHRYYSSPLGWAVHGSLTSPSLNQDNRYHVVSLLVAAGATVETDWLVDDRILAQPRMLSALQGNWP